MVFHWVLIIVGLLAYLWFWFFIGSTDLCPACGLELPDDFGQPRHKRDQCPKCGWDRDDEQT